MLGCSVSRPLGRANGYLFRHAVQLHALLTGDGTTVVMVGPGGELKQAAFGGGVESLSHWLVEVVEAVFNKVYQW